eukprot:2800991-Rhodomonas_salina.1
MDVERRRRRRREREEGRGEERGLSHTSKRHLASNKPTRRQDTTKEDRTGQGRSCPLSESLADSEHVRERDRARIAP